MKGMDAVVLMKVHLLNTYYSTKDVKDRPTNSKEIRSSGNGRDEGSGTDEI